MVRNEKKKANFKKDLSAGIKSIIYRMKYIIEKNCQTAGTNDNKRIWFCIFQLHPEEIFKRILVPAEVLVWENEKYVWGISCKTTVKEEAQLLWMASGGAVA